PLGAPNPGSPSPIPSARSGFVPESAPRPAPVTTTPPLVIPANPTPSVRITAPSVQSAPPQSAAPISRTIVIPNANVSSRPAGNPSVTPAPSATPVARQEAFRPAPAAAGPAPSVSRPAIAPQTRPVPAAPQFAPAPAPAPNMAPAPRPVPTPAPAAPSFQPSPRPAPSAAPAPGPAPSGRPGQRGPVER
ncbi:MAG: hypothetical protein RIS24_2850, partial [Verrucomicrobiota bacterium]